LVKIGASENFDTTDILVLKSEVDALLSGEDVFEEGSEYDSPKKYFNKKDKKSKSGVFMPTTSSISNINTVSHPTPINRNFVEGRIKDRILNLCVDDIDPAVTYKNANQTEFLVPIRLDMDIDGKKLKETFHWNKNESIIKPEEFGEALCNDLDLNPLQFVPPIKLAIEQQLDAASSTQVSSDKLLHEQTDQRVVIKLNIHIGNVSLTDQFEWDMSDERNDPQEFSNQLVADLGLGNEFIPAIVHSIRGQILWHKKMYACSDSQLPRLETVFRNDLERSSWSPFIEILSDVETNSSRKLSPNSATISALELSMFDSTLRECVRDRQCLYKLL
jgi:SWI/SNF-related matrix-associated actin-dependent regulator of chromatin subfamily B protein 1